MFIGINRTIAIRFVVIHATATNRMVARAIATASVRTTGIFAIAMRRHFSSQRCANVILGIDVSAVLLFEHLSEVGAAAFSADLPRQCHQAFFG